jgi:hypothetical protein
MDGEELQALLEDHLLSMNISRVCEGLNNAFVFVGVDAGKPLQPQLKPVSEPRVWSGVWRVRRWGLGVGWWVGGLVSGLWVARYQARATPKRYVSAGAGVGVWGGGWRLCCRPRHDFWTAMVCVSAPPLGQFDLAASIDAKVLACLDVPPGVVIVFARSRDSGQVFTHPAPASCDRAVRPPHQLVAARWCSRCAH